MNNKPLLQNRTPGTISLSYPLWRRPAGAGGHERTLTGRKNMFSIREIQPADNEHVIALHFAGLRESGSLSSDTSLDVDLYAIADHYPQSRARFLVAVTMEAGTEKVVGMGAVRKRSESVCEIKRMRVAAGFRREGIAQAILDQLIAFAQDIGGVRSIILDTAEAQTAAQRLYEKSGFFLDSRKEIGGIASLIYKKSLT
ncbi:GNAT family N-acetyltransferase [Dickeya dadantii]|uniref:GNAT family N-acetyltransferase n=1 Tax=Dickeya dadantii TaxID=204038 RepID=UPI001CF567D3|nr:GNAT family N-acetyltransferase [Dickeya dadantii]MCA7012420.1 GNAT family N-acetyltransferase [Dickeya dadantii]